MYLEKEKEILYDLLLSVNIGKFGLEEDIYVYIIYKIKFL